MGLSDKILEKDAYIENLIAIGYVTGITGVEKISEAQLCIDKKNYRIVILNKYDKNLNNYSNSYASDYKINCIIDFKYERSDTQKFINQTVVREYFKLIVSNSQSIDFYVEKSFSNTDADEAERLSDRDKRLRLNLIYPFIHLIEDKSTMSWVNQFCENNDLLPLFDETEEVSVKNMKENARVLNV